MKSFAHRTAVSLAAAGVLALVGSGVATADESSFDESVIGASTTSFDVFGAGVEEVSTGTDPGDGKGSDNQGNDDDDDLLSVLLNILGGDENDTGDEDGGLLNLGS